MSRLVFERNRTSQLKLDVFVSRDLFNIIESFHGGIKVSNGLNVMVNNDKKPGYKDRELIINRCPFEIEDESGEVLAAFTEIYNKTWPIEDGWKTMGSLGERPGFAYHQRTIDTNEIRVVLPESCYIWLIGGGGFVSHRDGKDGLRIIAGNYNMGLNNGQPETMFITQEFKGQSVIIKDNNFINFEELMNRFDEVKRVFEQLVEASELEPLPPPIKLPITHRAYNFAGKKGYTATNGITIRCFFKFVPGFGIKSPDTVNLDSRFINHESNSCTASGSNFKYYARMYTELGRIRAALAELEVKAANSPAVAGDLRDILTGHVIGLIHQ